MDDLITREAIERDLSEARERLKVLDAETERQRRVVAALFTLLAAKYGASALPATLFDDVTPTGNGRFSNHTIKHAMQIVLQERGEPMSAPQILQALEVGGKQIKGKSKRETVRSILRRDTTFTRVNGGWTLASLHNKDTIETGPRRVSLGIKAPRQV